MWEKLTIISIILSFGLMGFFANAQVRSGDVVLSISPELPVPNQTVTATLSSHSINLNNANISWSLNNELLNSGIGKKTFSFKMGNAGNTNVLTAEIETLDGQNVTKTLSIMGADVDLLWEAKDVYTPPFYKGKALVPTQGQFKVVAIPNIVDSKGKVSGNNLSYTWTKDGSLQSDSSGWGKNYFIFTNSYLDKGNTAAVKVSDISGKVSASGQINLAISDPKIIFYKRDSTLGTIWDTALNNSDRVDSQGKTFVMEPYFFSPKDINSSDLAIEWYLNGQKIETPNPKNELSIKPEEGKRGKASLKVIVNNINSLFQEFTKQLTLEF